MTRARWRILVLCPAVITACVTGSAAATEVESPSDPPVLPIAAPTETAPNRGSVFVDPLGFLLFGPTFGVEAGSGRISGTLYGRWLSAGILARSLFLKDNESFGFSFGAGLRGRYFFQDDLSGPHLGIGAELIHTRVDDSANLVSTRSTYVVPLLEGGYRLPFSGAYLDAAAAFGYAFKASTSVVNLPGGIAANAFSASDKSTVYGTASLELGVYF